MKVWLLFGLLFSFLVFCSTWAAVLPNSRMSKTETQLFVEKFESVVESARADSYPSGLGCRTCRLFLNIVREFWTRNGVAEFLTVQLTIRVCIALGVQHRAVCQGIISEFRKELAYILDNDNISTDAMCTALLEKRCGAESTLDTPWNITMTKTPKPPTKPYQHVKPGSPIIKVLHLTDLHIDPEYRENTSSECGEPICCREVHGPGDAGYYGNYGCDIPLRTLESALQHAKENYNDISYILLTGDIPPHNVWEDTKESQITIMRNVFEKLREYFPDKRIFAAVGNHDSHPVNSFPPPELYGQYSIQWLYDGLAEMWSPWLPNDTSATIREGGFYTTLVSEGLRIVSINSNYCNKLNWWLLENSSDPVGELQWLIQVLQNAENKGEKVHIISHIPSGNSLCFRYWSRNYYNIINRYENTVAAQFSGHTHQDHFEIFYDLEDVERPTSLWYIAPSLTTYDKYQPSYRIYEIDGDHENTSWAVLDHKTIVMDLEKSNVQRKAIWKLEYSAKDAYNMTSLHPRDWNEVVKKMEKDDSLFQMFYRYKYHYPKRRECHGNCKKREICELRKAKSSDKHLCYNPHSDNVEF